MFLESPSKHFFKYFDHYYQTSIQLWELAINNNLKQIHCKKSQTDFNVYVVFHRRMAAWQYLHVWSWRLQLLDFYQFHTSVKKELHNIMCSKHLYHLNSVIVFNQNATPNGKAIFSGFFFGSWKLLEYQTKLCNTSFKYIGQRNKLHLLEIISKWILTFVCGHASVNWLKYVAKNNIKGI